LTQNSRLKHEGERAIENYSFGRIIQVKIRRADK